MDLLFVTSFAFCVITFEPIEVKTRSAPKNDRLNLSFVNDKHIVGKKMVRNEDKMGVSYCYSFLLRL